MMNKRSFLLLTPLATTIYNLMLAYVVYFLARVLYLVLNYSYFAVDMTYGHLLELFLGGLVFDTSAILVTNIPYIVLMLLPWHRKENPAYQNVCRWLFLFAYLAGIRTGAVVNGAPGELRRRAAGADEAAPQFPQPRRFASLSLYGEVRKRHCGKAVVRAEPGPARSSGNPTEVRHVRIHCYYPS